MIWNNKKDGYSCAFIKSSSLASWLPLKGVKVLLTKYVFGIHCGIKDFKSLNLGVYCVHGEYTCMFAPVFFHWTIVAVFGLQNFNTSW